VTRASLLAWLASREPQPPATLAAKLVQCIATAPDSAFANETTAQVAAELGLALLRGVAQRQRVAYDTALDLLAADAFVTYAFEAASDEGTDVTGLARTLLGEVQV
jgi:hypothetical protein